MIAPESARKLVDAGMHPGALRTFPDVASLASALSSALGTAGISDPAERLSAFRALLVALQLLGRYAELGRVLRAPWSPVREQCTEVFDAYYVRALEATSSPVLPLERRARFQELVKRLASTQGAAGAVAECGCFKGLSAHLLCQRLRQERSEFDGADFHLFDSFEGLSEPTSEDAIASEDPRAGALTRMSVRGNFAAPLELVRRNLKEFPRIAYHAGWIPDAFRSLAETRYRFVHIDVDLYQPTRDCVAYFFPRLSPGGMLISDDYGWPGARSALEQFSAAAGARLEVTAHGQAIVRPRAG